MKENEMKIEGYFIGEEKKCPVCKSKKISILETFQVWQERKMDGKKIYNKNINNMKDIINIFILIFYL